MALHFRALNILSMLCWISFHGYSTSSIHHQVERVPFDALSRLNSKGLDLVLKLIRNLNARIPQLESQCKMCKSCSSGYLGIWAGWEYLSGCRVSLLDVTFWIRPRNIKLQMGLSNPDHIESSKGINCERFLRGLPIRPPGSFYRAIWVFVGVICIAVPLFAAADWTENRLRLEWRNYLTQVCPLSSANRLETWSRCSCLTA